MKPKKCLILKSMDESVIERNEGIKKKFEQMYFRDLKEDAEYLLKFKVILIYGGKIQI